MEFIFTHPRYLFLLLIVPIFIALHFISLQNRQGYALKFANFSAIARIKGVDIFSKGYTSLLVSIALITCIVLAISGFGANVELLSSDFSFVIAVDSSQSMSANDILPNRISVAKDNAILFVESAPIGTKFGLVSFTGNAKIQQDLTTDKDLIKRAIASLSIQEIGGTDISEAISTSINIMQNEKHSAIILLSDGQINVGSIDDAVEYANKREVIVHTISLGTVEGGSTVFGISKVDEEALKSLAYNTGGSYFNAISNKSLSFSFEEISELKIGKVKIEFTKYLLFIALFFIFIQFLLISFHRSL